MGADDGCDVPLRAIRRPHALCRLPLSRPNGHVNEEQTVSVELVQGLVCEGKTTTVDLGQEPDESQVEMCCGVTL